MGNISSISKKESSKNVEKKPSVAQKKDDFGVPPSVSAAQPTLKEKLGTLMSKGGEKRGANRGRLSLDEIETLVIEYWYRTSHKTNGKASCVPQYIPIEIEKEIIRFVPKTYKSKWCEINKAESIMIESDTVCYATEQFTSIRTVNPLLHNGVSEFQITFHGAFTYQGFGIGIISEEATRIEFNKVAYIESHTGLSDFYGITSCNTKPNLYFASKRVQKLEKWSKFGFSGNVTLRVRVDFVNNTLTFYKKSRRDLTKPEWDINTFTVVKSDDLDYSIKLFESTDVKNTSKLWYPCVSFGYFLASGSDQYSHCTMEYMPESI